MKWSKKNWRISESDGKGNDRNHSEDFRTLVHEVLAMMRGGADT